MSQFAVESWIWYGVVILMVCMRFIARYIHFSSLLRFQIEDYLMLFLTCLYTILIAFLNVDADVSTNLIDPSDPPILTPEEIASRTWGSKMVLLVECCMCAVQWGTKSCLLLLYWRLTQNLIQNIVVKCAAAYVLVTYVVMEILYFGYWCRPFSDYWQTPTDNVQCTTALHHLIMNFAFNLSSDLLIMSIPLPLLIKSQIELKKKLLLVIPFSMGIFTIVCAILSKHLSFTQPFSADWVFWYCREASTAMIVTNMPYVWTLVRKVFHIRSFMNESEEGGTSPHMSRLPLEFNQISQNSQTQTRRQSVAALLSIESKSHPDTINMMPKSANGFLRPSINLDTTELRLNTDLSATSSTSAESFYKPTAVMSPTTGALNKLYPLDDYDSPSQHQMPER